MSRLHSVLSFARSTYLLSDTPLSRGLVQAHQGLDGFKAKIDVAQRQRSLHLVHIEIS